MDKDDSKRVCAVVVKESNSDCIFCRINNKEAPANIVFENDDVVAFTPIDQISKGHTLVVPRKHYENIFDIDTEILKNIIEVAQNLSKQISLKNNATGINLLHASGKDAQQSVFHFHMHIVPRHEHDGLDLWLRENL